jgi:hypothetical protein
MQFRNLTKAMVLSSVLSSVLALMLDSKILAADIIVGENVEATRQIRLDQIDHAVWDGLLKRYVDVKGMVNYKGWKANSADLQGLDQYLVHLSHSNSRGTKEQQLAFWINTYNAVTVAGILREYPTSSIRNHTAKFSGFNIWKNLKLVVGGKQVSLDEMEHQVLRKMGEPRIHFAIVCASIGCPRLLNEAYVPERLEEQLTENSRSFFADASKFRYDDKRRAFHISPIIRWFGEDFGGSESVQLKTIAPFISDSTASQAAASGRGTISFVDYDWGLNDQK